MASLVFLFLLFADVTLNPNLWRARDAQDRAALVHIAAESASAAEGHSAEPDFLYRAALAQSTLAEVAMEVHDKLQAKSAAEAGMKAADKAVALRGDQAEYHRILGTLCGQAAAAVGGLGALKYGRCALDEVNKALELDSKSALNYLSHGVGNYYLPQALGGGVDLAIRDFEKAILLEPRNADAQLWLGVALRKANRNAEAQKAFERAVQLNPARVWAKQQLDKSAAR
jgi:tetratricopeptide (TPR) repeat protein